MAKETIGTTWGNFKDGIGIRKVQCEAIKMVDTTTTTTNDTTNLHEDQENKFYNDDDKEITESLYSLFTTLKSFQSAMAKLKEKGVYDDDEEASNLKSLFKGITRAKAAVTSTNAHAVEGSERSDQLRQALEELNQCLYWSAAASTGAGCFIKKRLVKLVEVIINDEKEEDCCAICLEGMKSGDVMGWIEHCDHSFHYVCLNQWMRRKHTCPVCRFEMDGQLHLINGGNHH